jgi:SAM-dependent methyltransferase
MKTCRINKKKVSLCLILFPLLLMLGTASGQYQNSLDVPFVPTPEEVVETMLAMAEISENDVLYDLGCGDGRIVIKAAKKYNCRGVGIDLDPVRIRESQVNAQEAGVEDRVEFMQTDLFKADFSQATVVTLYLLTEVNRRIRPRLLRELNPGTRIVSHDFDMGEWAADKESFIEGDWDVHAVYFWKIPANVSGTWKWTLPDEMGKTRITLKLDQMFQSLIGKFTEGTLRFPSMIEKGTIDGTNLFLVLESRPGGRSERLLFEGTAEGHTIRGTVKREGRSESFEWTAKRNPATMTSIDGESAHGITR